MSATGIIHIEALLMTLYSRCISDASAIGIGRWQAGQRKVLSTQKSDL